jgi:hypothetical protein
LDIEKFGAKPYLKISGIAVALGEALELANRPGASFDSYKAAFDLLQDHRTDLSPEEQLRCVALAHKLGDLAEAYSLGDREEEKWRTWAVEESLRIARASASKNSQKKTESRDGGKQDEDIRIVLTELELPHWLNSTDVGAPLEALGEFYARSGRTEYEVHCIALLAWN